MYSYDLRCRVIWLKFGLLFRTSKIVRVLRLPERTVRRIVRKFTMTGLLNCCTVGRPRASSFHRHEIFVVIEAVLKNASLTLRELQYEISRATGTDYHLSTVFRNLKRFGLTRKTVSITHK